MNNPLQGVIGHLELLMDMTPAAKPVKRELKQIFQEADRAARSSGTSGILDRIASRQKMQVDRI
jgi:hypothetical protein